MALLDSCHQKIDRQMSLLEACYSHGAEVSAMARLLEERSERQLALLLDGASSPRRLIVRRRGPWQTPAESRNVAHRHLIRH